MMALFAGIKFLSGAGWMSVSVVPAENLALCNTQRSTPSAKTCIVDGDKANLELLMQRWPSQSIGWGFILAEMFKGEALYVSAAVF